MGRIGVVRKDDEAMACLRAALSDASRRTRGLSCEKAESQRLERREQRQ
jgi:hypothetical protein